MVKFAAVALTSVLGIAGLAAAAPASAGPYVALEVPVPVPAAIGYVPRPYWYAHGPGYWHPDFYRHDFYRDQYRYRGYADHFHR